MNPALLEPASAPAKRSRAPACRHCGAALLDTRAQETGFCCAGCAYVFRLVHEHGLAGYYRIKDEVTAPADAAVLQTRDYTWLATAQTEAEIAKVPTLTLDVQGISCAGCVWLIERVFQQHAGARDIWVQPQYGTMRLRWVRGEFSAVDFARKLQAFGYLTGPAGQAGAEPESRALARRIGLCTAFAMNVMLFAFPAYFGMEPGAEYAGLFGVLALGFGTLSLLAGGGYFLGRAVRALREGVMHIDLPISVGIVGAYAGSLYGWIAGEERYVYFDFVAAFILLMLVGRWAQVAAVERNRRRLLSQQPQLAPVQLASGESVAAERIKAGEAMLLAPGQTLAVEARLEAGDAEFSLASINGEAAPRRFHPSQRVPAGAVNLSRAAVRLIATQAWADSLLAQLLQSPERGEERSTLLEKIVRGYLIGIFVVAAFAGVGWWLATHDLAQTGAVVTAVLVVSCPCAVGLAFPLADELATVALRRRGVFVRESGLWTRLARVRTLVFDKTGTLTLETPVLRNPDTLAALNATAKRALLALVRDTAHPVSQCLHEHLAAEGVGEPLAGELQEVIGCGVALGAWSLGRTGWRTAIDMLGHEADGATIFARDGEVIARFYFDDLPRADAAAEIRTLTTAGFPVYILSGDSTEKVQRLATALGLPATQAYGDLTPQGKADWLAHHGADHVLMLGDGANDSLAFDKALCRGTPVVHRGVLERKADFYYLGRGIGGIRTLLEVDRVRRRVQSVILAFSVGYNLLAVGLAVAGHMSPLVAAILMPINSLLTLTIVTAGMRSVGGKKL